MGGSAASAVCRIPVATVISMLADRMNIEEMLTACPDFKAEDGLARPCATPQRPCTSESCRLVATDA
jgi:Protein of unknown function (DUF433)